MLTIKELSKNFGPKEIFKNLNFSIFEKERVCLIAPNGTGKTTLLNMILKKDLEYDGTIEIQPKNLILSIAQQLPNSQLSLFDFVTEKLPVYKEYKKLQKIEYVIENSPVNNEILEKYGEQLSLFESYGGFNYIHETEKVLAGLSFDKEKDFHRSISTFSGGELRRALLAEVLIQKPDLLILDEPTNHLDLKNILFLENFLKRYSGTLLFISHDTEFINNIATHIASIESGKLVKVKGSYDEYIENLLQRKEVYEKKHLELEDQIQKLKPNIEKFKAGTRSSQAQSMQKRLDKMMEELKQYEVHHKTPKPLNFRHRAHKKPFNPVLKIQDFSFKIHDRLFFDHLNLTVERGEKIALLAPNGTGKTLFLSKIIEATEKKNSHIMYGQHVDYAYFLQEDKQLALQYGQFTTLAYLEKQFLSEYTIQEYHQFLSEFHLRTDRPIHTLSGGEQSKLRILTLLLKNPNFLILDEPTNHMDIQSIEGISDVLQKYQGTLIIVTHNRKILRDLNPHVYLLQEQKFKSMEQKNWNEIFHYLLSYETRLDTYETQDYNNPSVIQEIQNSKLDNIENKEKPKFISKEFRQLEKKLKALVKEIEAQENELKEWKQKQFQEEVYIDYQKAQEIQTQVQNCEAKIQQLYLDYSTLEEQKKQLE